MVGSPECLVLASNAFTLSVDKRTEREPAHRRPEFLLPTPETNEARRSGHQVTGAVLVTKGDGSFTPNTRHHWGKRRLPIWAKTRSRWPSFNHLVGACEERW
jgi:hypothetical protein